ncbi:NTP transferase domain-containing protein [Leptobacterium flavescens]|uniref:NTP transferase domain-containing protein n=1 Tax=Leptobacterium flavescens TaxID=472055 RepID=A0A6P0UPU3_9FLAO|nr:sugar phosphate nucleotidyltransferase [Leptobacterium flavescens]NER14977.1 NTP transferase domain-containing protein [Leptobacterium flavescens]
MHQDLIILAGGASSRMKKSNMSAPDEKLAAQANSRSKGLISIDPDGRPLMDYLLYNAKRAGYTDVYIVIGGKEQLIQEFYGEKKKANNFHGLTINYAVQYIPEGREKPFGTADAVSQAVSQYPELNNRTYTVCNSDNLYSESVLKALRMTQSPNAFIAYDRDALLFSTERIAQFALASLDKDGFLVDIIEKPDPQKSKLYKDDTGKIRVSMNIFKFSGPMFNTYVINCPVNKKRNEKELPTALLNMVQDHPSSVKGVPASEHVPDLTSKDDIERMKNYIDTHYSGLKWDE